MTVNHVRPKTRAAQTLQTQRDCAPSAHGIRRSPQLRRQLVTGYIGHFIDVESHSWHGAREVSENATLLAYDDNFKLLALRAMSQKMLELPGCILMNEDDSARHV
ncbi:hypothetical protein GCM10010981_33160 [Dyella nitratireducens]|uniref:Uncharacterized protein n=1 Tax=Dyella nitratireducens TaxID=1849580 RepID=A0ABQ1GDA2_9GAMM|nr:hypothetical protein GCM10010981_33160 [Dyella nitratireducens]